MRKALGVILGVVAVSLVAISPPVVAQGVLEDIVVTARKREESLQDLALSVSAMGQREIEQNFATDLRDLVYVSPNLVLDDTNQGPGGVAAAYIRGIGVSEVEKNFDPAVGVVVDGVFRGTMTGSITRAIDLERMEVLRGPQGTLFGRNTIGGVINLTRTQPTKELGGKFRIGYGDYDTTLVDGLMNFGNGDTFGVKLTGTYRNQREGYVPNAITGRDDGKTRYISGGINILLAPTENLEIEWTTILERTEEDASPLLNVGQPGQLFCDAFGWCSPDTTTPVSGDRYKNVSAFKGYTWIGSPGSNPNFDFNGLSPFDSSFDANTNQMEVRWEINDAWSADYIIGWWDTKEKIVQDFDAVPDLLFHTDRPAEYEQLTNELRFTFDDGGPIAGTVGLYTWDSEYEIRLLSWIGFAVPDTLLELPQFTNQESESWAVFFEGDWEFVENWTLTLGGRYTEDEKSSSQRGIVPCGQADVPSELVSGCASDFTGTPIIATEKWDEFTPKVALKWDFSEIGMIYGLYSRGYRAGGFNGRVDSIETAVTPYDPETVDNFELGIRTAWLDNRLIFNATAFYMDYEDKQEEIQQPSSTSGTGQVTRVVNAATAEISGAEFDLTWLALEGLTLRANLGLLDAKYDEFLVDTGAGIEDFSNLDFRRAPEVTAALSGDYVFQLGEGDLTLRAGLRFLDKHATDFANKPELNNDAQTLIDASIQYDWQQFYASVWGRNLADEDGYQIGFDVAGLWSYAAPRTPRLWGVEFGMRFGDN